MRSDTIGRLLSLITIFLLFTDMDGHRSKSKSSLKSKSFAKPVGMMSKPIAYPVPYPLVMKPPKKKRQKKRMKRTYETPMVVVAEPAEISEPEPCCCNSGTSGSMTQLMMMMMMMTTTAAPTTAATTAAPAGRRFRRGRFRARDYMGKIFYCFKLLHLIIL